MRADTEDFDESLDNTHEPVEIGGESFPYSWVYKTCYPDGYEEDYDEWCYKNEGEDDE